MQPGLSTSAAKPPNPAYSSAEGNFFQSLDFLEALQKAGWKTEYLKARTDDCEASVLAFAPSHVPIYHRLLPTYRVLYGPCVRKATATSDSAALSLLLRELCRRVRKSGAMLLTIATPFPFPYAYRAFREAGFTRVLLGYEYTVFIDLEKDLKTLWGNMKRFARRSIKKAVEKGLEVREVETEAELEEFYRIYASTALRRGFQPFPFRFFDTMWNQLEPRGRAKFFMVWLERKPIGGILNTFYGAESVPYIACSLKDFWHYHPNHVLFWHSIKWSKDAVGSKVFKLYHLPSGKVNGNGIDYYTFKTCFGGHLAEERAFYHNILSPTRYRLSQNIQRILKNWPDSVSPKRLVRRTYTFTSEQGA